MLIIIVSLVGVVIITYQLVVHFNPAFGGSVTKELKKEYAASQNYENGKFINIGGVEQKMEFSKMVKLIRMQLFGTFPNTTPEKEIPVQTIDSLSVANYEGNSRLIWFGHSTFLLQMQGKTILIDPMFGHVPAPIDILMDKRFSEELPITIEQLPKIDAVIISHDHYDHLDYGSILKLKDKVEHFVVPLGVNVHLEKWGIPKDQILQLDWWQDTTYKGLKFVCTPAQHFSGRRVNDKADTLWSSWVIQSETENIFFSGDSGYGPHFKEIGAKYGPFDFAMLECGQYNKMWPKIHMMPEEAAQAGIDVRARQIMPIHWGAFKLAMHSWTDPVERIAKKAEELDIGLVTPKIGKSIELNNPEDSSSNWWQE